MSKTPMGDKFTERDAIREARGIRAKLVGTEFDSDNDPISICPILTAGRMAQPNWERGAVACLGGECALFDIDSPDPNHKMCQIYNAGMLRSDLDDGLSQIYELLRKRL